MIINKFLTLSNFVQQQLCLYKIWHLGDRNLGDSFEIAAAKIENKEFVLSLTFAFSQCSWHLTTITTADFAVIKQITVLILREAWKLKWNLCYLNDFIRKLMSWNWSWIQILILRYYVKKVFLKISK